MNDTDSVNSEDSLLLSVLYTTAMIFSVIYIYTFHSLNQRDIHNVSSPELGHTVSVLCIPSIGTRPVRTAIRGTHSDSGKHFMYLKVATEADQEGSRPYSVLKIAKDNEKTRRDMREARKSPAYKAVCCVIVKKRTL